MAVAGKKRTLAPVETDPEARRPADAEPEAADAAPEEGQKPDAESERPRRKPKARTPQRDAFPLNRLRQKGSSGGSDRRPMQRSLISMMTPQIVTQRAVKVGGGVTLFIVLIVGLVVGYYLFAGSRFFKLKGIDVEGNSLLSATEVEMLVRSDSDVDNGVLNANLAKIQKKLQKYPLIRSAQVIRLLPDRLRVTIVERTPVAVVRLANESNACVDEDGAIFGDLNTWRGKGKRMPPVIRGLAESGERMAETNKQWIQMYRQLIDELDETEPALSSRVSEVIFDSNQGIRLVLENKGTIVLIGRSDFRTRLNAALDVIDAVERNDVEAINVLRLADADRLLGGPNRASIKYLNVTDPNRVIVGLDE